MGLTITAEQLAFLSKRQPARVVAYVRPLCDALHRYEITTPLRAAHFLGQLMHESGRLRFTSEIWGPTAQQQRYEPPGRLAESLGNTRRGDGARYRGRGLIQLTGRANYRRYGYHLRERGDEAWNVEEAPDAVAGLPLAVDVAGWYWAFGNPSGVSLNVFADEDDLRSVTRYINGGYTHLHLRARHTTRAKAVLAGLEELPPLPPDPHDTQGGPA